jgi:protein-S-isoprenylcysteine O-methyltransferase Ste14
MPTDTWFNTLTLVAAWLFYFVVHSVLASLAVKKRVAARWPGFMPAYRLVFNALALALLLPIVWVMAGNTWPPVWQWHGVGKVAANTLSVLALLGFFWSLKAYDLQEFLGLRQWRGHVTAPEDQEHLQISNMHRFVRHPWYCFALVLLWTRDMNAAQLVTSVMASAYFAIGARLEERKLLVYYGERYRRYMERVPGLFPLPWKFINAAEAKKLRGD